MQPQDFEKLGSFYLGRTYDLKSRSRRDDLVLYDSKDLVTHAVCVGMTGSGKTGLCTVLLEEAALDGIPSLVIDPKGDLGNLVLTFPNLQPSDFQPWVNEDDARRKGMDVLSYAAQQAEMWKKGLAEWGQDGGRVSRLRESAQCVVYTPGSGAGLGVSVLKSFDAPPFEIIDDAELLRERIQSTVTSLLGLLGVEADPLRSREHILLATIFDQSWRSGRNLDLPSLIQMIQTPPVSRVGVMELETFYPSAERFELAMSLNNLIASPGFSRWLEGEGLDIGKMLYTPQGKPRIAIISIAHLSDPERMFIVSLVMNQMLGWIRAQTGTTSLRAILYMDEIAGYVPPVANPPSKAPMLTLMKQGRAFGLGVVLATQNPVDLDYKGLSNAGTWLIGRLQTEQDKARVLDGLQGAAASASAAFDRSAMDEALSQLGSRVFLMNNVHEDVPVVFETRWAMSYLRGPLTRSQIKQLMDPLRGPVLQERGAASGPAAALQGGAMPQTSEAAAAKGGGEAAARTARATATARSAASGLVVQGEGSTQKPVLPPDIPQFFLPPKVVVQNIQSVEYRPMLLGCARVYYSDSKNGVDMEVPASLLAEIRGGPVPVDWERAATTALTEDQVDHEPIAPARFAALPSLAGNAKSYAGWQKSLVDVLFRVHRLELLWNKQLKAVSTPGEDERTFRVRLQQQAREQRDEAVARLRAKYAPKLQALTDRIRRAQQQVAVQQEQARSAKASTAISFGSALLGALMGRKVTSVGNLGRAATAARGVGRSAKEASDVGRAQENMTALQQQLAAMEAEFQAEVDALSSGADSQAAELDAVSLKPKKANISVRAVVLAWAPYVTDAQGVTVAAWKDANGPGGS